MASSPISGSPLSATAQAAADEDAVEGALRVVSADSFDVEPPYEGSLDDLGTPEVAQRFLDRELSWLHLKTRVLELAEDTWLPD